MKRFYPVLILAALLASPLSSRAADAPVETPAVAVPERVFGNPNAPIKVEEFVSLTCPHCAEFYNSTLPQLEKAYVDTGKVKFILRDFPLDGTGLKAAALARCMPADEYFPFISVLYKNQVAWVMAQDPDKTLIQYAKLGGLSGDEAEACLKDTKMQDAIVAERTAAEKKYDIQGTPDFIINDGAERVDGPQSAQAFGAVFDKLLAEKKAATDNHPAEKQKAVIPASTSNH